MDRLLFLNRSYYPDAEATGQLLTELCAHLATRFQVSVIPGQPNQNPLGVPFRGWGTEVYEGVTIQRVWNSRLPKRWLPARVVNLLSYLVLATWTTLTQKQKPDLVVVETDPPLLCLVGSLARRRYGCKLVVYLQDIYPDLAIALGKVRSGWFTRWLRRRFFEVYRSADRVVVLSRDMRDVLIEGGVSAEKVVTIANWTDCGRVAPRKVHNSFRQVHRLNGSFVVMYSGNMGLCQGLENVLAAAARLTHRQDILFLLIGDGSLRKQLEQMAAQRALTNVRFLGYQPSTQLSESLSAADVHLVPLDARVSRYLMPSKLYGVLASGTALIAVAPRQCELAEIVQREQVGYVVEPDDPGALARQIEALADHPDELAARGRRARQLVVARYDRSICVAQFASMISALMGPDSSTAESTDLAVERLESTGAESGKPAELV